MATLSITSVRKDSESPFSTPTEHTRGGCEHDLARERWGYAGVGREDFWGRRETEPPLEVKTVVRHVHLPFDRIRTSGNVAAAIGVESDGKGVDRHDGVASGAVGLKRAEETGHETAAGLAASLPGLFVRSVSSFKRGAGRKKNTRPKVFGACWLWERPSCFLPLRSK